MVNRQRHGGAAEPRARSFAGQARCHAPDERHFVVVFDRVEAFPVHVAILVPGVAAAAAEGAAEALPLVG